MAYVEDLINRLEETPNLLVSCFPNGLYSVVKNQHVREVKCIAAGDPYCEWEVIKKL